MRSAIFVWASLLLIGSVSISQGYSNYREDSDEDQLNDLEARLASVLKSESKRDRWFNAAPKKRATACTPCNPACQSDELCTQSGVCACPGGAGNSPCPQQHHPSCEGAQTAGVTPVKKIDFGEGTTLFSPKKATDFGFSTAYTLANTGTGPADGSYSIMNQTPGGPATWMSGQPDHSKQCAAGPSKGYMLVVNAQYDANKDFLTVQADKLCLGVRYEFSFWAANIVRKGSNINLPNFSVTLKTPAGATLGSLITGLLTEQPTVTWVKVGLSFIATSTSVVASLNSITAGGSGNDFVLDDIQFLSCVPNSNGQC